MLQVPQIFLLFFSDFVTASPQTQRAASFGGHVVERPALVQHAPAAARPGLRRGDSAFRSRLWVVLDFEVAICFCDFL